MINGVFRLAIVTGDSMIKTEVISPAGDVRISVQANSSMSWRANLILVGSVAFFSLGLAGIFAAMGYWLILPFAGLELLALLFCLQQTLKRLQLKEVITFDQDLITLEWGVNAPQKRVKVPRQWSRLSFKQSDNPFEVDLLLLLAHNKSYKLGSALGKPEKQELFKKLKEHFSAGRVRVVKEA